MTKFITVKGKPVPVRRKNASPKGLYINPVKPNEFIEVSSASLGITDRHNFMNKRGLFDFVTRKQQGMTLKFEKIETLSRDDAFKRIKDQKLRKFDPNNRFEGEAHTTRS